MWYVSRRWGLGLWSWIILFGLLQACNGKEAQRKSGTGKTPGSAELAAATQQPTGEPSTEPAATADAGSEAQSSSGAQAITLAAAPNKCLDVRSASTTNGTPIQLYDCNQTEAQRWTYVDGTLRALGGKCLDVTEGQKANGTPLQLWECSPDNPNQQWQMVGKTIVWAGQNKCVDLPAGNRTNATVLQIVDCEPNNPNQEWAMGAGAAAIKPKPPENPTVDAGGWELVWQDEFSGEAIDQSKWAHEVNCWGGGNQEHQCYTDRPQNSFVKDGALHLVAQKESFTAGDGPDGRGSAKTLPYTSARLRTLGKGDFKYGKVCARAKLPMGQGVWPAIWMLPSEWKYGPWPLSGEIDIMEARSLKPNEASEIFGTLHFGGDQSKGLWKYSHLPPHIISGDPSEHAGLNFHTYCVLWDDDAMHWEVDGTRFSSFSDWYTEGEQGRGQFPAPFDQKFHIILNVAVGGNFAGNPNEATAATPESMVVDWVRVYSCKANPTKPSKC